MSMSDPIADMLTRIRNGQNAKLSFVHVMFSNLGKNILEVLKKEGYINNFIEEEIRHNVKYIKVNLKYYNGQGVIKKIEKISKPGRRRYCSNKMIPRPFNGLGIAILSTSKGIVSDYEANISKVGGEILCYVF